MQDNLSTGVNGRLVAAQLENFAHEADHPFGKLFEVLRSNARRSFVHIGDFDKELVKSRGCVQLESRPKTTDTRKHVTRNSFDAIDRLSETWLKKYA